MKKIRQIVYLYKIYLFNILNSVSIIVLSISLLLVFVVLVVNSNPFANEIDFLFNRKMLINEYLNSSFFFLNLFNAVLVSFLCALDLVKGGKKFDQLFYCYFKKEKIVFVKILVNIFVLFLMLAFELLFCRLIGLIVFNCDVGFDIFYNYFICQILLIIYMTLIGNIISIIFKNFLSSAMTFLYYFIFELLCENNLDCVLLFYPKAFTDKTNNWTLSYPVILYLSLVFLLFILSTIIYKKRN